MTVPTPMLDFDAYLPASYPGTGVDWTSVGAGYTPAEKLVKLDGSPTFNAGGWFEFDGNDSFQQTSMSSMQKKNVFRTASTLYWVNSATGLYQSIVSTGSNVSPNRFELAMTTPAGAPAMGGFGFGRQSATAFVAQWVYFTMRFKSATAGGTDLFINGVSVSASNVGADFTPNTANNFFTVGRTAGSASEWFSGRIMRIATWGTPISDAEIAEDFNSIRGRVGL